MAFPYSQGRAEFNEMPRLTVARSECSDREKSRPKIKPGPKCNLLLGDSERTVRVRSTI